MKTKIKNPDKVRAGKARWKGVSDADRHAITSANGKKGAKVFWANFKKMKKASNHG